jgi:hypothetical protein
MNPPDIPRETYLEDMFPHYLACCAWSTSGTDQHGEEVESLEAFEFSTEADRKAREVCDAFLDLAFDHLGNWSPEQAGHDLWLTSAQHGAGFWGRGFPEGAILTNIAHTFPMEAYVADDGEIQLV